MLPGRFSCRTASTALHFLQNSIDKLPSHRHSCRAVAGKHHSDFRREKTRKDTERGCAFCVQSFFSCLSKFSVIQFSQVIRLKETLCGTNGYSNPPCPHSAYRKTSVHNLVSPIGGKTISNKSSIIILRLSEERIYT